MFHMFKAVFSFPSTNFEAFSARLFITIHLSVLSFSISLVVVPFSYTKESSNESST